MAGEVEWDATAFNPLGTPGVPISLSIEISV